MGAHTDQAPPESSFYGIGIDYTTGAGTTKRKELHGTTCVRGLSGTWANNPKDITLNAYQIKFVCNQAGKNYGEFILLIEATLDDDISGQEIDLYLHKSTAVKTSVSLSGQVHLNSNQIENSKLFQEFLFNGLFGKLFTGSKSKGAPREFLLKDRKGLLWSTSNMYLLLPMKPSSANSLDPVNINWKAIDECISVAEILRNIYSMDCGYYYGNSLACSKNSYGTSSEGSDTIHVANKSVSINALKGMVVLAIHTGRIYSVLDVIHDKSAESSFDKIRGKPLKFISFTDYFYKQYNIVLQHPGQPLLLVKQSYLPHNLLLSTAKCEDHSMTVERAQVHVPPELLVDLGLSSDVLRSFYLLPSLMHRLASVMLACQLREYIGCSLNNNYISSILILEAITTLRCCDNFSLERLELLGDSVLKYAVSCHLFMTHPLKNEGQLSEHRSLGVCNSMLHKLGTHRSLQVLGDILESIAGALLIDTNLDLDKIWGVFEPLLSPIVTPDNLELPPLRELLELCSQLGYPVNTTFANEGEKAVAELSVQLEDDLLVRRGCDAHRKAAKAQAALSLLKDLKERGISHAQQVSKRSTDVNSNEKPFCSVFKVKVPILSEDDIIEPISLYKQTDLGKTSCWEPSAGSSLEENGHLDNLVRNVKDFKLNDSVALSIKMEKGGPRNALFELCRILRWPMPRFESTEEKFRKPIILNGAMVFNKHTSSITLYVPNSPPFMLEGDPRADKKSSRDSAALVMLRALEEQGRCVITES